MNPLIDALTRRPPPKIGIREWAALHDRPAPQRTFTSHTPRVRPVMKVSPTRRYYS